MKNIQNGITVPQNKQSAHTIHAAIEQHAETIWHTTELLRNQQSADDDKVTIGQGSLQMCCQTIDSKLCKIVELCFGGIGPTGAQKSRTLE